MFHKTKSRYVSLGKDVLMSSRKSDPTALLANSHCHCHRHHRQSRHHCLAHLNTFFLLVQLFLSRFLQAFIDFNIWDTQSPEPAGSPCC